MSETLLAALQMVSGDDLSSNLEQADQLIAEAVAQGAQLLCLPENFAMFSANHYAQLAEDEVERQPIQRFISESAKQYGCWIC